MRSGIDGGTLIPSDGVEDSKMRHVPLLRTTLLLGVAALFVVPLARRRTTLAGRRRSVGGAPHRVVVAGAGFGGMQAAKSLARLGGIEVTLLDERNHHLFQPLLYQVATAVLSPDEIASPVRSVLTPEDGVEVLMETVTGVDLEGRAVLCGTQRVPYDTLILATGSEPSYFGHDEWQQAAPSLKTLDNALDLRRRILTAFEDAVVATQAAERERLLTFVLVGGGPTGVEMAGSIAELAHEMLTHEFHDLAQRRARVVLVEAGPQLLPGFSPELGKRAARDLRQLGAEIRLGAPVTDIAPGHVAVGEDQIAAGTIVWTAGVTATPVAAWLGVAAARGGRVAVGPTLELPGWPGVYVIGDAALALDRHGNPLPGLAPVAKQQGAYVARRIIRQVAGRAASAPFHYQDWGALATIGRNRAVAEFGAVHLTGFPAWLTWAVVHIFFLIGFRNRFFVSAQWLFSYVMHRRGGRVIT